MRLSTLNTHPERSEPRSGEPFVSLKTFGCVEGRQDILQKLRRAEVEG